MKFKDLLIIIGVSLASFPVVLGTVMYATGFMRVSVGWEEDKPDSMEETQIATYSPHDESLAVVHSKTFQALEAQRREMGDREKKILEDEERLGMMKQEVSQRVDDLQKTKKRLEELVKESSALAERRLKQLSQTYAAMRPEEAAPILFTLKDPLIVKIIRNMPEERKRGKMLSALGKLSKERTGRISRMLQDIKVK